MELLTTKQAAAELGMTDVGVRKAIQDGRLAAQRVGRDYAILRKDLEKYRQQVPTTGGRPRGSKNQPAKGRGKAKG